MVESPERVALMIVLYLALALVCGFVAGFLVCWVSVRSRIDKIEALFERYKTVEGESTRPTDQKAGPGGRGISW